MGDAWMVLISGIALASIWYWIATMFRVIQPFSAFKYWVLVFVPQGVALAWAIKIILDKYILKQ